MKLTYILTSILSCTQVLVMSCGPIGDYSKQSYNCMMQGEQCHEYKKKQQGEPGVDGSPGSPGEQGKQGIPGAVGAGGPSGPVGETGPAGPTGIAGASGPQGVQGTQGPTGPTGPTGNAGPGGPQGSPGQAGQAGQPGQDGQPGTDGIDGSSCTVTQAVGGALISCQDGTQVVVLDGQDGSDGSDGADAPPTPYTVVGLVDPCGHQSSYDEVLLRLGNGQLMAHYSAGNGNNRQEFLTIVGPGSYVTTDGTHCYFTVDSLLNITGEHN